MFFRAGCVDCLQAEEKVVDGSGLGARSPHLSRSLALSPSLSFALARSLSLSLTARFAGGWLLTARVRALGASGSQPERGGGAGSKQQAGACRFLARFRDLQVVVVGRWLGVCVWSIPRCGLQRTDQMAGAASLLASFAKAFLASCDHRHHLTSARVLVVCCGVVLCRLVVFRVVLWCGVSWCVVPVCLFGVLVQHQQ